MAERKTTQTPDSSTLSLISWQLMHLSFQRGFDSATAKRTLAICEDIRTRVMAMEASPPTSGPQVWRSLRDWVKGGFEHFELLQKLWRLYRAVPWGTLAWGLFVAGRWLHLF